MSQTLDTDSIIEEIHQIRRTLSEKFGGNLTAIAEDARKRQEASGHPVWQGKSSHHDEEAKISHDRKPS